MTNLDNNYSKVVCSLTGVFLNTILSIMGIMNGNEAIQYYGEIHYVVMNL